MRLTDRILALNQEEQLLLSQLLVNEIWLRILDAEDADLRDQLVNMSVPNSHDEQAVAWYIDEARRIQFERDVIADLRQLAHTLRSITFSIS